MTAGIFQRIKDAKDVRRQKVLEYERNNVTLEKIGTAVKAQMKSTTMKATSAVAAPVVAATSPVLASVVPNASAVVSSPETKTLEEQVTSFTDNIVNPENHPDEPVTKQSSDDPTEEDDEESQDDLDNEDKDEAGESTAELQSPINDTMSPMSPLLDQIKSDDGNTTTVETFAPPNSIKPMEKEDVEKFIAEQKAQANTGLLCGCI